MTAISTTPTDLAEVLPSGELRLNLHRGQARAWLADERFILVLAGTQGGKTSFGPHWCYREMQRRGPGDGLVVTPTFQLLEKKALPEFLKVFQHWLRLGTYKTQQRAFVISPDGQRRLWGHVDPNSNPTIWFGYAADPESLESATAKWAWLDEAGQNKFKLGSWEAILRRLSLAEGRVLISTTPYNLGWLYTHLFLPWKRGQRTDVRVVRFDSTENPNFPQDEFERARRDLPDWKFKLFYRAIFTRPAGLIYDSFISQYVANGGHLVKPFPIPAPWQRGMGLDFGGVNTAAVKYAQDPRTRNWYLYKTYRAGSRSADEHVKELRRGEPARKPWTVGGSWSEDQWRREFALGGLQVLKSPIKDVEVGIDRTYAAHRRGLILVFDDQLDYLDEIGTYSREVDDKGEATEKIEDKNTFHLMDADRYFWSYLLRKGNSAAVLGPPRGDLQTAIGGLR